MTACRLVQFALLVKTTEHTAGSVAALVGANTITEPEVTCGPVDGGGERAIVWTTREPHTGLDYHLSRFDLDDRPLGDPIELGWGYDGHPACVVGWNRDRWAIVWAFADPYGGSPELNTAIVERDRRIAHHVVVRASSCWELHPVALTPAGSGWRLDYRCDDSAPTESIALDRDGRAR